MLALNSQRSARLCLPSAVIRGMHHQHMAENIFFIQYILISSHSQTSPIIFPPSSPPNFVFSFSKQNQKKIQKHKNKNWNKQSIRKTKNAQTKVIKLPQKQTATTKPGSLFCGTSPSVWLVNLVTLHWRKLIFFFASGYQLQIPSCFWPEVPWNMPPHSQHKKHHRDLPRLLAALHSLMVRPYCWRHHLLKSLNMGKLSWCQLEVSPLLMLMVLESTLNPTGDQFHLATNSETYSRHLPAGYTGAIVVQLLWDSHSPFFVNWI